MNKAKLAVIGTTTIATLITDGAILVTEKIITHKEHNSHSHVKSEFPLQNSGIGQSMYNINYNQFRTRQTDVSFITNEIYKIV